MKPGNANRFVQKRLLIAAAMFFSLFSLAGFVSHLAEQLLPSNNVELVHSQKQPTPRHSFCYAKYVASSNQAVVFHRFNEHTFLFAYNNLCNHRFIEAKDEFDFTKSIHSSFLRKTIPQDIDYPIMCS